jgi:hypothetical protein
MKMNNKRWVLFCMAIALLLLSQPALAHHGSAAFDRDQVATIKGTVVDYELINPHVQITVKVANDKGEAVDWIIEGVSLNMMVRSGFTKDLLKAGDTITVTGHPGKNGKPTMLLMKVVLADGQTVTVIYD